MRTWLVGAWLCGLACLTATSVPDWHSDLTVWKRAVFLAPTKPRPMLNYGVALAQAGELKDAIEAFNLAYRLSDGPFVPVWERADVRAAAPANIQTLARFVR